MTSLIKKILSSVGSSNGNVRDDHADDIVDLAATHFAGDFPNQSRDDCPPPGTLSALISSGLLPSDDVREHMLMCSECFAYYRRELAHRRANEAIVNTHRTRLVPILAGGLAAVLAVLAVLVIYSRNQGTGENTNVNPAPGGVSAPIAAGEGWDARSSTTEAPANRESTVPNRKRPSTLLIAENRVTINLENFNPLRGGVLAQPPPEPLRATRNELLIKLPADSPHGAYTVTLTNPYGRTLRSAEVVSRDGAQLQLKLNLISVKPGDYLLCVTRQTEVPQCIPTVIKPVIRK